MIFVHDRSKSPTLDVCLIGAAAKPFNLLFYFGVFGTCGARLSIQSHGASFRSENLRVALAAHRNWHFPITVDRLEPEYIYSSSLETYNRDEQQVGLALNVKQRQ